MISDEVFAARASGNTFWGASRSGLAPRRDLGRQGLRPPCYLLDAAVTVPEPMYQACWIKVRKIGTFVGHAASPSSASVRPPRWALKTLELYGYASRLLELAAQKAPQFRALAPGRSGEPSLVL